MKSSRLNKMSYGEDLLVKKGGCRNLLVTKGSLLIDAPSTFTSQGRRIKNILGEPRTSE